VSAPASRLQEVDAANQLADVLALPDHLRDALWRVESARIPPSEDAEAATVCGMGGSAIGGDLAAAALGDRLVKPMTTVRGYELPSWAAPRTLVLCSSYSGDTEETLACFDAAEALGAPRIVATTGGALAEAARRAGVPVIGLPAGLLPRAAVAYMFVAAAEAAALAGAGPRLNTEVDIAAAHLEQSRTALAERAAELADRVGDAVCVVYGSGLTAPIAYRWKCQLNENGKVPAFWAPLPEADHNELAGWAGAGGTCRLIAIFLADRDQHPRERRRFELTAKLVAPTAVDVIQLETEGETATERLLRAVMLGDLLSLHVAARRGIDPSPVEAIDRLKDELGTP
jgi:glucose/mannose-6-phosphate isomerase